MALNVMDPEPAQIRKGEALLVQMFGSVGPTRTLAGDAGKDCGLSEEVMTRLRALLAMIIGGYLSARLQSADLVDRGGLTLDDLLGFAEG